MIRWLATLFSREGIVWIAAALLVAAALSGWLETPLQGGIRGYALDLFGGGRPTDALTNPPRLLSFALPCLLGAAMVVLSRTWRRARCLLSHVGPALLVVVLCFPVSLVGRNQALVGSLADQNEERSAILAFASLVGSYAATMPESEPLETSTLVDRVVSVVSLVGYGWWCALVAAGVLAFCGAAEAGRRGALLRATGWTGVAALAISTLAAPAVVAEYHRLKGEAWYAGGQYQAALARFHESLEWDPSLRENEAFQYRLGATLFWLGDAERPATRLFLAQNRRTQGELEMAALHLRAAAAAEPGWKLARRKLAEVYADLGLKDFRRGGFQEKQARWERAAAIDDDLLRIHYYLAYAYYRVDERDHARAVARATHLLALTRDRGVRSDLFTLLGHSYFKAQQFAEARKMYRRALAAVPLVSHVNVQAQQGLLGL